MADLFAATALEEQQRKPGHGIVAPQARKGLRKVLRPGQPGPSRRKYTEEVAEVGLVGEEALHALGELAAKERLVLLVGQVDEGPHRVGIEVVRGRKAVVPVAAAALFRAQHDLHVPLAHLQHARAVDLRPAAQHHARFVDLRIRRGQLQRQRPGGELLGVQGGHLSAGAAAGPLVLVVDPGLQAELCAGLRHHGDVVHPFIRQIGRLQAVAGMGEGAADALVAHVRHLAAQLVGIEFCVPGPEGQAAITMIGPGQACIQVFQRRYAHGRFFHIHFHASPGLPRRCAPFPSNKISQQVIRHICAASLPFSK